MESFSSTPTLSNNLATIFVGDLSVFCGENELTTLFSKFGTLKDVRIIRETKSNRPLSYGFVEYCDSQSAEQAMNALNGFIFMGRSLRVRWATAPASTEQPFSIDPDNINQSRSTCDPSVQIFVSFISNQLNMIVTEEYIRQVFSSFGTLADVCIKKINVNNISHTQNGFGFVQYQSNNEGVSAALKAVEWMNKRVVEQVKFDCKVSKQFELFLEMTKKSEPSAGQVVRPAAGLTSIRRDENAFIDTSRSDSSQSISSLGSTGSIVSSNGVNLSQGLFSPMSSPVAHQPMNFVHSPPAIPHFHHEYPSASSFPGYQYHYPAPIMTSQSPTVHRSDVPMLLHPAFGVGSMHGMFPCVQPTAPIPVSADFFAYPGHAMIPLPSPLPYAAHSAQMTTFFPQHFDHIDQVPTSLSMYSIPVQR